MAALLAPGQTGNGATSNMTTSNGAAADVAAILSEPHSLEETGLTVGFLSDLAVKIFYFRGSLTGFELAETLRLPFHPVIESLLEFMKREKFCQIRGSATLATGTFEYVITDQGREKAKEILERNQYVGPAPVPLTSYNKVARAQRVRDIVITPQVVRQSLAHLVLSPELINRVGVAVNSGQAMFLYGLPGNGKTVIAEAIGRNMLPGNVYVPHAVEVDGQVIKTYDPLVHEPLEEPTDGKKGTGPLARRDLRWVRCKRPVVISGGELIMESLDLNYNSVTKYYEAPLQMKANNGIFLIDDFGRQLVRPRDLLNRWIVPLEKQVDYLTLHTGKKIEVPFEELIIFSTNLDPKSLVDEAFLRRIRHKIDIPNPTVEEYREVFRRICNSRGIPYDEEMLRYLLETYYVKTNRGLRSCHPRDLIYQAMDAARFLGLPARLTKELIDFACNSYFVETK
jgi:predicted ATPase with chaperone activity